MNRRRVLALTGSALTAGVAGCSSSRSDDTTTQSTATPQASTTEPMSTTAPTTPVSEVDLDVESEGLQSRDADDQYPNTYVPALVTNTGGQDAANLWVRARWYNENDYLLSDDSASLLALRAGESWYAWVYPSSVPNPGVIESVDVTCGASAYLDEQPEDVVVEEATLYEGDVPNGNDQFLVSGLLSNETGEMSSLSVYGILYDSEGNALVSRGVSQSAVPAGDTWKFSIGWGSFPRALRVDDFELFVSSSPT